MIQTDAFADTRSGGSGDGGDDGRVSADEVNTEIIRDSSYSNMRSDLDDILVAHESSTRLGLYHHDRIDAADSAVNISQLLFAFKSMRGYLKRTNDEIAAFTRNGDPTRYGLRPISEDRYQSFGKRLSLYEPIMEAMVTDQTLPVFDRTKQECQHCNIEYPLEKMYWVKDGNFMRDTCLKCKVKRNDENTKNRADMATIAGSKDRNECREAVRIQVRLRAASMD
ncbi:hypothetical protein HDU80_006544 [Chytriomyces hyalinus]|nr:hypothetical protein HDU80_006544 [Chytriomyces hyalinus]